MTRVHTETQVNVAADYPRWRHYLYSIIAAEISGITRYYDQLIQWKPRSDDHGLLLASVDCPSKKIADSISSLPELGTEKEKRTAVLLNGSINHSLDIQALLVELKTRLSRTSRVLVVAYNPYLSWLYRLANFLGFRRGELPSTFITQVDIQNLTRLAGYDFVQMRAMCFFPWRLLGLGNWINRVLPSVPLLNWMSFAQLFVLRPVIPELTSQRPSLSIVIPARNEKGNIENALKRMPDLGTSLEIIFVEGHSSDGTWEEIERVRVAYQDRFKIKTLQQTGKGKANAVHVGFAVATGDLLTILDADLTMPPELLGRFYTAYCDGLADFINGTRLVYPMEGDAMRFLNRLGNIFFAKALSHVLGTKISDSLCGTKLVSRHDYARFQAWKKDFGDFDPFGDFELIFPAAILGLGIVDIPIRYLARTYGSTNISRFRHGLMLLRMTLIGFFRIKMGRTFKSL